MMEETRTLSENKAEYQQLLKQGFPFLRFRYQKIENNFNQFYNHFYHNWMSISVLIAISIFAASGIFDAIFIHNHWILQIIRFFIIIPILLICFKLIQTKINHFSHVQWVNVISIIVLTIGVLVIGLQQPNPMRDMYLNGILLIQMYTFILSRLQFWKALMTSFIIFILLISALTLDPTTTTYLYFAHSFIYLSGMLVLGFSSYLMERSTRIQYLQKKLLNIEQHDMKEANKKLEKISCLDELTEIFNYRHFKNRLESEWRRNMRESKALALCIIDVDYFKEYNDTYGHLAGNECLKSIANAVSSALYRSNDLAARYGGDEFVILMTPATRTGLQTVLERIQENIKLLNKNLHRTNHGPVTVSIGAAIIIPEKGMIPNLLIDVADNALFQAKKTGRNRVILIDNTYFNGKAYQPRKNKAILISKKINTN